MFSYQLPDDGSRQMVRPTRRGKIKFEPPVSQQLMSTTMTILEDRRWSAKLKKIVQFGCSQMSLLRRLRRINTVEYIMGVDIDELKLQTYKHRAEPLIADFIKGREHPLRVEIYLGSISDFEEKLHNIDAVIALELLQELTPDILEKSAQNVFGFIQPKLAIFSTPNRDMNILLDGIKENGLRSDTHMFEWTRSQFRDWTEKICKDYPNYSVAHLGIGSAPPTHKKLGFATQMAIFVRNDFIDRPLKTALTKDIDVNTRSDVQYKEIFAVDFPQNKDNRTTLQKIKDEALHYINISQNSELYHNRERCIYQIPIKHLNNYAQSVNANAQDVLNALNELEFKVENDFIVLTEEYVEENTCVRSCDLYDSDQYQYDEEIDDNSRENTPIYVDCDEPEENWD